MTPRKLIVGLVLLAAAVAAAVYQFGLAPARRNDNVLRVSGNIEVIDAEVAFNVPGRVGKRFVDEGEPVKKGQPIAELDPRDIQALDAEVALRQAEVAAAKAAWDEVQAGSRPEEIEAAKAALDKAEWFLSELEAGSREQEKLAAQATMESAQVEMERLEKEAARAEKLYIRHAISEEDRRRQGDAYKVAVKKFVEARERYTLVKIGPRVEQIEQARAARDQARAQYELVKKGPRQEVKDQALARLEEAQAALEQARTRRAFATVYCPLDGIVLTKNAEPGEYVAAGTPVVTVGDLRNIWLRAYVEETELELVKVGQRATVTTDSYPGKPPYEGRVSFVASEAEFTPKNVQTKKERTKLVYRIKIDVDNPAMELKRGMPADAAIQLDSPAAGVSGPAARPESRGEKAVPKP